MGIFSRSSSTTAEVANQSGRGAINLVKGSGPAVPRATVEASGGVDLAKRFDKAGISLSKRGLDGIRAQVYMLLDHSGSMYQDYQSGVVQKLVERALGFAAQVDVDGRLPLVAFDTRLYSEIDVDLNNFANIVNEKVWSPNTMGGTLMAPGFQWILNIAKKSDELIYLIVIGDGSPGDRAQTTALVKKLSHYGVFIKFLAVDEVDYLQELDDLPDSERLVDNVDAKFIPNPDQMSDLAFADAMTEEWDTWIAAAKRKGIVA